MEAASCASSMELGGHRLPCNI